MVIRSWRLVLITLAATIAGMASIFVQPSLSSDYRVVATATPSPTPVPPGAAAAVNGAIARLTKNGMENSILARVIAITPTTWTNECLDLPSPNPCQVKGTPGFAIEAIKAGSSYLVRTDSGGTIVRIADAPQAAIPDAFLQWEKNDGKECRTELIGSGGLQYGHCGEALISESPLQASPWSEVGRTSQAEYWKQTFAPFTANTVAGTVIFSGTGSLVANQAEQRAITEWARQRFDEHWAGYLNAVYDLELGWSQNSAGFCGGLWIYRTGLAVAWNCEGNAAVGSGFLKGDQLDQFFTWLDGDKRWLINTDDDVPGVPAKTSLSFRWDDPSQNATDQDTEAMLEFLHEVYSTLTANGTAKGKVVAGYGAHAPVAGLPLWIGKESRGDPDARTDANGEFTLSNLPVGLDDVVDTHLAFQVPVTSTDSVVNLGVLKYPLYHPPLFYYSQSPAPLSSLQELLTQGRPVTFTVCQTDSTWTRPTDSLQRDQVWSKDPFGEQGEKFLDWWFYQPAILYDTVDIFPQSFPDGPNLDALASDWRYLSGMWTGQDLSLSKCSYDAKNLDDLLNRGQVEVWLLGYRAAEVKRLQMPYTIVQDPKHTPDQPPTYRLDQPSEQFAVSVIPTVGFQIIRFPAGSGPLSIHVVENGVELITLPSECRSQYSPDCAK